MKDTRVAKRYAAALFEVAQRHGILDAVAQDMTLIERFLAEVHYLRAVLLEPMVSDDHKYSTADKAFGDRVTQTSLNFLKLLIRKRREDLIDVCIAEFREQVALSQNRAEATVTTAVPLSETQAKQMTQSLQKMTGKTVTLTALIDPAIIGGAVIRMGDTVIDGSVRGRLARLERQLLGSA